MFPHNLLVEFLTATREDLFDVLTSLGRSLEALVNIVLPCELDGAIEVDLSGRLKLAFVADEVNSYIFSSMLLDLLQPASQVFKSLIASDIIRKEDAMRTAVKNPRHRLETFLTSLHHKLRKDTYQES